MSGDAEEEQIKRRVEMMRVLFTNKSTNKQTRRSVMGGWWGHGRAAHWDHTRKKPSCTPTQHTSQNTWPHGPLASSAGPGRGFRVGGGQRSPSAFGRGGRMEVQEWPPSWVYVQISSLLSTVYRTQSPPNQIPEDTRTDTHSHAHNTYADFM